MIPFIQNSFIENSKAINMHCNLYKITLLTIECCARSDLPYAYWLYNNTFELIHIVIGKIFANITPITMQKWFKMHFHLTLI